MPYSAAAPKTTLKTVSTMSWAALCALLGLCLPAGLLSRAGAAPAGLTLRAGAASASSYVVTRTADDTAPGSLRAAITAATATGGTITFAIPNTDPGYSSTANTDIITLSLGPFVIPASLTITGPVAPSTTVTVVGVGAYPNQSNVFSVTGGTVAISNLAIQKGSSYQGAGGGDILNAATLTLTNCAITGGTAFQSAQVTAPQGGDILNTGTLTMTGCTVSGGAAVGGNGNGISNSGAGASLTLTNCTISGNVGQYGGNGGGIANSGTLMATGCLISGNRVGTNAGNVYGGGLLNSGTATLNSCTLSGNSAISFFSGTVLGNGGGASNSGSLTLNNSLVASNSAIYGGGLYNDTGGTLTVSACTLSGNSSANYQPFGGRNANPGYGGGSINFGTAFITDCLVVGNRSDNGDGMDNGGTLTLINSTFTGNSGGQTAPGNTTPASGGLLSGPATLVNDIFYGDAGVEITAASGTTGPTITYSDVQQAASVYPGQDNINLDPQFVRSPVAAMFSTPLDPGDEHLKLTSPAVYAGTNAPGVPLTDIAGTPRPAPPATPSMGAYEIPGSASGFSTQGGFAVTGTQNVSTGAQVVAKFLPGTSPIAGFTATVDTGDGSVVPGLITPDPTAGTVSQVTVSHTYATSGVFPVTVTISGPNNAPTATVTSTANIQPVLSSVSFPASVPGGTVLTATVALSGPALADTLVGLSSSDAVTVRLFRSVVVPAGSSSATFAINTFRSHTNKTVTITASLGSAAAAQDLTITGR